MAGFSGLSGYLSSMTEQIERRIKRSQFFTYFFSKILGHSVVYSGSRSEGVPVVQSDTDVMFEAQGVFVISSPHQRNSSKQVTQLFMDLADVHAGYTKLLYENNGNTKDFSEFAIHGNGLHSLCQPGSNYVSNALILDYWNSQAAKILPEQHREEEVHFHGPCVLMAYTRLSQRHEVDITISFQSEWPFVAREWLIRDRKYDWPSSKMIYQIKAQGINLVPVGHADSQSKELEWRLSFSKAERILVWSFNPVQQLCMSVIKHFFNSMITPKFPDLFPSYFIKTAMFWMIEETESSFWNEENLLACISSLFERLISYLEEKKIDNYFIPEDNMMDAKQKDKLDDLKQELLKYHKNCSTVWMQLIETGMSSFDSNDIYHYHIQINCLSLSRYFIYVKMQQLDFETCMRNLEEGIAILIGIDIFPDMRRHLLRELNITKTSLKFYKHQCDIDIHSEKDIRSIEDTLKSGCVLYNATGKLTFCTYLLYSKQYQEALTLLQETEDQFTDLVVHYSFSVRSKKPNDEDYDLSKPRSSFEDTMRNFIALDVVLLPSLLKIYPQAVQSILSDDKRVLFLHPAFYAKTLKFHCHFMLQNLSDCQNVVEEMKMCSTLQKDNLDSTVLKVVSNCEKMMNHFH